MGRDSREEWFEYLPDLLGPGILDNRRSGMISAPLRAHWNQVMRQINFAFNKITFKRFFLSWMKVPRSEGHRHIIFATTTDTIEANDATTIVHYRHCRVNEGNLKEKSEKSNGPRRNMRFKLILCCFLLNIGLYTKFHQNRKKNTEVENIQ